MKILYILNFKIKGFCIFHLPQSFKKKYELEIQLLYLFIFSLSYLSHVF